MTTGGRVRRVEFYYDLVSPYSYLAHSQLGRVCEAAGAELVLRPVLLGAVQKAAGVQAPIHSKPKARYQWKDIHRWAEHYGLPMRFPQPFPFRPLTTMRAALYLEGRGELASFTREAFTLYWEEGGAPRGLEAADEEGPVAEVARRIGANPDEVLEGANAPETKAALKDATDAAVGRGVFAAPVFFVGEEMFWGNDRLPFVETALGS
jgi:2-hydroxychromene-2-carboxylate isomerase